MEVGEKAGDESEGTDTERDIPEGEEEENIQGQKEEQPEGQQVDSCGSSDAPFAQVCDVEKVFLFRPFVILMLKKEQIFGLHFKINAYNSQYIVCSCALCLLCIFPQISASPRTT